MDRITDRKFIQGYCDWCSKVNWYSAQLFLKQLESEQNLEIKKALFVKIYMELIQACEHLIAFVHTIKKSDCLKGFKNRLIKCPSSGHAFRYLWNDLRKLKSKPGKVFPYLGINITSKEYEDDKLALDGIYYAILASLRNRYIHSQEQKTSRIMKAFGKLKHGFPLHTPVGTDRIYIFLSSGRGVRRIQTNLNIKSAQEMCGTTQAIHNTLVNLSGILLDRGITTS